MNDPRRFIDRLRDKSKPDIEVLTTLRLPPALHDKARTVASRESVSFNALVVLAVRVALEEMEK